jgi:hypothetical protein
MSNYKVKNITLAEANISRTETEFVALVGRRVIIAFAQPGYGLTLNFVDCDYGTYKSKRIIKDIYFISNRLFIKTPEDLFILEAE